ncbi:hypothetical protein CH373_01715 [Leptospira perolatii]|uniref:Uncharacterized protein n=1 Tax=Leptospira perolatii TaxID=2023191 RepID=A0A2M9ZRX8_9LEPT|nr:hypothetical protein [Leptospira perolatii]PJZ71252.1 hypothetical protein CH360_01715 [Leptospira perolatii]PJZ74785.1 hypothetical protein CH373_01715 [Leptospira perolatii]
MTSNQVYSFLFQSWDSTSSLYVLFGAILDPLNSRVEKMDLVAVGNSELINIPLSSASFKDVLNLCQKIKYETKQLKNLTIKLAELFQQSGRSDDFMEQLLHYVNKREDEKIRYLLNQVINQAIGNSKPDIALFYRMVDRSSMDEANLDRGPGESLESSPADIGAPPEVVSAVEIPSAQGIDSMIPQNATRIQFKFMLSPVSGIPVNQLKPGDQVVLQLIDSDPTTKSVIDSLKLRKEDGSISPVPGSIVVTENKGTESEAVVKIGNDIFGKIYEEENSVKVRLYTGEKSTTRPSKSEVKSSPVSSTNLEAGESSLLLTVLIALGILGIGMVLVYVFLF